MGRTRTGNRHLRPPDRIGLFTRVNAWREVFKECTEGLHQKKVLFGWGCGGYVTRNLPTRCDCSANGTEGLKEEGTLTDPLTDKEREHKRQADDIEGEADRLSVDRALLAIKATLGGERAAE